MPVIKIENLTKIFSRRKAVSNLTLEVGRGELFGLVGPDGAGKTTTLRLLSGILDPTSGNAWIAGLSIHSDTEKIKETTGYMSQRFGLYEDLTVIENILFYADIYDVPKKERAHRIERLLGFSNLTPFRNRLAGTLSGGMKQKLGLACALIHTPQVLFLDEPTNGVDPVSRRDFWKILYDLLKEKITIFVSTSYLDEAERCMRIGLMHQGRLLVTEKPETIKRSFPHPMIEIWTDQARHAAEFVRVMDGVVGVSVYGDRIHIAIEAENAALKIRDACAEAGITVKDHRSIVPSLEDVFLATLEDKR